MSKLKTQIDADIKSAMLAKDNVKKEILKFIKSEIQRIEGGLKVLDDNEIIKIMRTQVENLKITPSETSGAEIAVLESYLPKLMNDEQIREKIGELISGGESTIPAIMKHFSQHYKGLVDNKRVNEIAKEVLV